MISRSWRTLWHSWQHLASCQKHTRMNMNIWQNKNQRRCVASRKPVLARPSETFPSSQSPRSSPQNVVAACQTRKRRIFEPSGLLHPFHDLRCQGPQSARAALASTLCHNDALKLSASCLPEVLGENTLWTVDHVCFGCHAGLSWNGLSKTFTEPATSCKVHSVRLLDGLCTQRNNLGHIMAHQQIIIHPRWSKPRLRFQPYRTGKLTSEELNSFLLGRRLLQQLQLQGCPCTRLGGEPAWRDHPSALALNLWASVDGAAAQPASPSPLHSSAAGHSWEDRACRRSPPARTESSSSGGSERPSTLRTCTCISKTQEPCQAGP